jgi:hypothetical protein
VASSTSSGECRLKMPIRVQAELLDDKGDVLIVTVHPFVARHRPKSGQQ